MKRAYTPSAAAAAVAAISLLLTACGGGGGTGVPPPQIPAPPVQPTAPAPAASPPSTQSSADCPTSGSLPSSANLSMQSFATRGVAPAMPGPRYVPGTIVYGGSRGGLHVVHVDPANVRTELTRLRGTPGVRFVQRAQYRRELSVGVNGPYYDGFGPGAPYYESSTKRGQWDMHVIDLSGAWSYTEKGAPIAIVDTGVDVTAPDLRGGKIVYTHCYVTYPSNAPQSSGPYVTDMDGHGTNVAGIADADTNNRYGFAGVGFNAPLLAFRIFPTPPSGGCSASTTNAQCETTDVDEVTAIDDAVAHGARVINLSIGASGPLSNCKDTIEENAVENAIAHGVVVVAAAGNETTGSLDCPAAYPGVIAVGASALEGSGNSVKESIASYSNWTGSSGPGGGGAFLLAPGGDPAGDTDSDNLHWIENIYSSTAVQPGTCSTDAAGEQGDCRIFIAGTSQATPHVAGVASLMLGVNPSLTPAQVAADICASATNLGSSKQGCGRLNAAGALAKAAQ